MHKDVACTLTEHQHTFSSLMFLQMLHIETFSQNNDKTTKTQPLLLTAPQESFTKVIIRIAVVAIGRFHFF